jgi:hypothetical protein
MWNSAAGLGADEGHQIAGVAELAARAVAAGQDHRARPRCASRPRRHQRLPAARGWNGAGLRRCTTGASAAANALGHDLASPRCSVPSCVEPPAPKVTEQNSGCQRIQLLAHSRAASRRPRASWGGKEFKAQWQVFMALALLKVHVVHPSCRPRQKIRGCRRHPVMGLSNQPRTGQPQFRAGRRGCVAPPPRTERRVFHDRRPCRSGPAAARTAA